MIDPVYWVWFASLFGYGTRRMAELLEQGVEPHTLFHQSESQRWSSGLFTPREQEQMRQLDLGPAATAVERARALGCRVLCLDDPQYPQRLQNIYAPPVALYVQGDVGCLDAPLAIGMVGSRRFTEYGSRMANRFSMELAAAGAVVVSGMAIGIDQICHTGAIKAEGTTIGVLGCGIDQPYPQGSGPLRELVACNGALVTEYPPGTKPLPAHFPVRNRILTGLCHGVVVVEAGERSGSLVSAGLALSQGRDVFAIPGEVDRPSSGGINLLLRQGAKPVFDRSDILEEYVHLSQGRKSDGKGEEPFPQTHRDNPQPRPKMPPRTASGPVQHPRPTPPDYLSGEQLALFRLLDARPQSADRLAEQLSLPVGRLLGMLTELEIYGLARAAGGGYVLP